MMILIKKYIKINLKYFKFILNKNIRNNANACILCIFFMRILLAKISKRLNLVTKNLNLWKTYQHFELIIITSSEVKYIITQYVFFETNRIL